MASQRWKEKGERGNLVTWAGANSTVRDKIGVDQKRGAKDTTTSLK